MTILELRKLLRELPKEQQGLQIVVFLEGHPTKAWRLTANHWRRGGDEIAFDADDGETESDAEDDEEFRLSG